MVNKKFLCLMSGSLCVLALLNCGGDNNSPSPTSPTSPTSSISPTSSTSPTSSISPTSPTSPTSSSCTDPAQYRATVTTSWRQTHFMTKFPSNPHFSPLVGAVHNSQVRFWEPGQNASSGIELMAETGRTGTLSRGEVEQAITNGTAEQVLLGGGIGSGVGAASVTFTAKVNHPQLTLVTMVAPSPDWFIGVHGQELRANNCWVNSLTINLAVYDAGTDSGVTYISSNFDTNPRGIIQRLTSATGDTDFQNGVHRASGAFIASMTITRIASP